MKYFKIVVFTVLLQFILFGYDGEFHILIFNGGSTSTANITVTSDGTVYDNYENGYSAATTFTWNNSSYSILGCAVTNKHSLLFDHLELPGVSTNNPTRFIGYGLYKVSVGGTKWIKVNFRNVNYPCIGCGDIEIKYDKSNYNFYYRLSDTGEWDYISDNSTLDVTGTVSTLGFGAPGAPTNLQAVMNGSGHPYLAWNYVEVPDISGYKIYRKINSGLWSFVANTSNNYYTDTFISQGVKNDDYVYYKIKSYDLGNNESALYSNQVWLRFDFQYSSYKEPNNSINKALMDTGTKILKTFNSPGNPSIAIEYTLEKKDIINISIYDIAGRKIAELINEIKDKGRYKIHWDTNNTVPTGIYLVVLQSGQSIDKAKVTLLK